MSLGSQSEVSVGEASLGSGKQRFRVGFWTAKEASYASENNLERSGA